MRVCPKCGFSDSLNWENCRFKRDLQIMQVEDFEREYPDAWKLLQTSKERYVRYGQFVYHKTKLYVLRKEPADWNQPFWEHFEAHRQVKTEKPDMAHYYNRQRTEKKNQSRLLEEKP